MARKGKKAGPRSDRIIARTRANASMRTSATRNIRMSSQNPLATSGNDSLKWNQEKNCRWTAGQASEVRTTQRMSPKTMMVEPAAINAAREPSSRERRGSRGHSDCGPRRVTSSIGEVCSGIGYSVIVAMSPPAASHSSSNACKVPLASRAASASFTHGTSSLSLAKSMP